MTAFGIAALLLAAVSHGAGAELAETAAETASEAVAFATDTTSRMTVPVRIDGRGPFDFVVDTGAERTVISSELAGALGLDRSGSANVHSISGIARFDTVTLPTLSVTSTPMRDVTTPLIRRADLGAAGLLGIDSLQSKSVLIDFAHGTMTVTPARARHARNEAEGETIVITARRRMGRLILADATASGRRIAIVIDTGAEYSIGNPAMKAAVLRRKGATILHPTMLHGVTGGMVPAEVGLVADLRIGSIALSEMPMAFADLRIFRQLGLDRRPAMLLGMNTLRAFRQISLNFATREVRFVIPGDSARPAGTELASAE